MMKKALLLSVTIAACGGASIRVIETTKQGGEMELLGSRDKATELAHAEMQRACGGGYEVAEEGEYVATTTPSGTTYAAVNPLEKRPDSIEWHARYTCNSAATTDAGVAAPVDASADVGSSTSRSPVRSLSVVRL